jgi:acyl-CoA synthetase (AMP-forming)/AMP-acid ligase II
MRPMRNLRRVEMLCRRDQTLGTIMDNLAGVHGDRRLVEEDDGGMRLTYQEAALCVNRWARGIREHTESGDRVVVATPNGYEQFLVCLAAARAGAIPVPVNPQMRPEEIRHVTKDCGASYTVHHSAEIDRHDPLDDAVSADPGDVAALFYTSGTTGKPKGAALTHRALLGQAVAGALWPAGLRRDEAVFSLPVAHIMGFAAPMGFACAGIPVFAMSHFRPDAVLDAIEARRCTIFIGVPAMYRLMLEAGAEERDLSCIRVWGSGADVMPTELALQFKRMGATATLPLAGPVGEAMFVEGYGLVEVGGGVAVKFSPPMLRLGLGDSVGVSLPQYKLRVADVEGREVATGAVGELWVKGPGVLEGYWNAPDASAAAVTTDGWLRTGDLARRGLFGTVLFVGRSKDVIKCGGYSVYALEVEKDLEEHPQVLEAAVIGLPDDRYGEVPAAVVRLADEADLESLELGVWAAGRMAGYKVPKQFVAVDDLPHTGTDKVQKTELGRLFD